MTSPRIGVNVDDLRLETKSAFRKAAELRFRVAEVATVSGELAPRELSRSARRHLVRFADGLGLRIAALTADLPHLRLTDGASVEQRVLRTCEVLDLARDIDIPVVSAGVGRLTDHESGAVSPLALEALHRIGEHADGCGVRFAIRPTRDRGDRVADILDALGCPSIQLCLDPAEIIMAGVNPLAAIERLATSVGLVHARDATAGIDDRDGRETVLGEGDVDFATLFADLDAAEHRGPIILRRTDSATPIDDLETAHEYIQRFLPPE